MAATKPKEFFLAPQTFSHIPAFTNISTVSKRI
jgi:hypothetical protein